MAIAIYLKTESNDSYLFCYDITDQQDIKYAVNAIANIMGEEMGYVFDWEVADSSGKGTSEIEKYLKQAIKDAENFED